MNKFIVLLVYFVPSLALAQGGLEGTIQKLTDVIPQVVPLLMSLAVAMFFWGIVKFIANMDDEEARKGGKRLMGWGMIALFVIVGFWGIVGYVQDAPGLEGLLTMFNFCSLESIESFKHKIKLTRYELYRINSCTEPFFTTMCLVIPGDCSQNKILYVMRITPPLVTQTTCSSLLWVDFSSAMNDSRRS